MGLSWPEPKRGCQVGCRSQFFLCLHVIGALTRGNHGSCSIPTGLLELSHQPAGTSQAMTIHLAGEGKHQCALGTAWG